MDGIVEVFIVASVVVHPYSPHNSISGFILATVHFSDNINIASWQEIVIRTKNLLKYVHRSAMWWNSNFMATTLHITEVV